MNLESTLKRVRMEIKFGRAVEAGERLRALWGDYRNTENEKIILEIYALDLLRRTKAYGEAIPVLHRLLELDIDANVRAQALAFLEISEHKERLLPSEPDASNPDFVEFMETVRAREIFKPAPDYSTSSSHFLIRRLRAAKRVAWHQGISAPYQSWNQLRTSASRDVHTHYFENKIIMNGVFEDICNEISAICEASLSPVMMHFFDDIMGDLGEIARGKLAGVVPDLHGRMWEAYRANVYPCGWRGGYPDGKLCVFPNR